MAPHSRWRWAQPTGTFPKGRAAALRFVADRPSYALVHFGSIIGVVLWTVGLRSSSALFDDTRARLVAQWASTVATIGAGVLAVQFSLDGFGLPAIADRFAAADLAARATLAEVAEVTADAMVGLALMWVIMLYGLAVSLLAAATLLDASVHRWLGFAGLAVGVWTGAASLTVALGGSLIPDWLAFVSGIVGGNLWLIGWAALIRRRRSPAQ